MKSIVRRGKKQIIRRLWMAGTLVLFSGWACLGAAQEDAGEGLPGKAGKGTRPAFSSVAKVIEGEVSAVNTQGIAVVFDRDTNKGTESEIFIPLEKEKIRMVHQKKIEDIKFGDTVKVEYDIITEETETGPIARFKARTVTFLKPAAKKPLPTEPSATGDDAEEEPLPLKGVKK